MSKVIGAALTVTGFLACPCHLLITLPLLAGLLGGTAAGAFLAANTGVVMLAASAYFVGGLGLGWYLLTRPSPRPSANAVGWSLSADCCTPAFDRGSRTQSAAGQPTLEDEPALPARY